MSVNDEWDHDYWEREITQKEIKAQTRRNMRNALNNLLRLSKKYKLSPKEYYSQCRKNLPELKKLEQGNVETIDEYRTVIDKLKEKRMSTKKRIEEEVSIRLKIEKIENDQIRLKNTIKKVEKIIWDYDFYSFEDIEF